MVSVKVWYRIFLITGSKFILHTIILKKKLCSWRGKSPHACFGFQVDARDPEAIDEFCRGVLEKETPYALVNNIGMNNDQLFLSQRLEDFFDTLNVNFASVVRFSKNFMESMMLKKEGHIINMSSVAANKPKPGNSAYGTSKIAIERFSKTLALELAKFNIKVNCIAPGFVKTKMLEKFLEGKNEREFYKQIPARNVLMPDDISNLIVMLC